MHNNKEYKNKKYEKMNEWLHRPRPKVSQIKNNQSEGQRTWGKERKYYICSGKLKGSKELSATYLQ